MLDSADSPSRHRLTAAKQRIEDRKKRARAAYGKMFSS